MSEESIIHPVIQRTSDFSDRLSPMLVKELRQGLKGISFIILFIAIQAILAFLILTQSLSDSYNNSGRDISTIVFICTGLATCVIQPLRAISAIGSEIKENTIDLLLITRLSAWKIVFGKWISLVSQSALIIAAVTPYLILRYFFGGMQLFAELMILLTIFLASSAFTAFFVGISALPSLVFRGIIGLGCAFFIGTAVVGLFAESYTYNDLVELCSFQFDEALSIYLLLVLGSMYLGWLALDFAAGWIAPISENRSTSRRLICLGIVALVGIIFAFSDDKFNMGVYVCLLVLFVPISLVTLTEQTHSIATLNVPFVRKGVFGKIMSYFLFPGWASGLNFVLLLFAITCIPILLNMNESSTYRYDDKFFEKMISVASICFSSLVFPLLLTRLFFKNRPQLLLCYIGSLAAMAVLWLLVVIVVESTDSDDIFHAFFWLPPIQFNFLDINSDRDLAYLIALPTFLIYWLACALTSRNVWQQIRADDLQAQEIISDEKIHQKDSNA